MELAINILIGLIALIHCYIVWFEMFAWNTVGRRIFRKFPAELFEHTKILAGNQGLYNAFLVAGLIWTFFIDDTVWRTHISLFFVGCVLAAGIYGALTADKKIFVVQAFPALITLILLLVNEHM